ncbi:MAG: glycosyltransferase family 39 protein [Candidatus Promineifilaceae bacterium]|nr:glycosyltransferase family 39 protein [Candidatus Promineifilaceae bacterium]
MEMDSGMEQVGWRGSTRAGSQRKQAADNVWMGWLAILALPLAIALALAGQWLLLEGTRAAGGALLFALSVLLFLGALIRAPMPVERSGEVQSLPNGGEASRWVPIVRSGAWRLLLASNSAAMALLAYVGFGGNDLMGGLWSWLAALFLFLLAFGQQPSGGFRAWFRRHWGRASRRLLLALALIFLVGIFFRTYRLAGVPAEMTSDHAEKLLDVRDVLNGARPLFFPRNTGREMVQFYLTAALIHFTPLTTGHLALKVGTALVGILTLPFVYLLGSELYGRRVGLLALFFFSVAHWHVAITRVGLRFPFTAAFAAPALFFLFRAFRLNRRNDWLLAGLVLGVGLHTYTAMRIVPLLFAVLVLLKVLWDAITAYREKRLAPEPERSEQQARREATALQIDFWRNAILGALAALLVFLPLLRYWREEPGMFWYRAGSRALGEQSLVDLWTIFWGNVRDALLMFNYRGDVVPANTIPNEPELGLVAAALFVLGVAYLAWRLLAARERRAAYVLLAAFILLLPSILSLAFPEENPSVVRTGGAIPLIMLVVALPLALSWERLRQLPGRGGRMLAGGLLAALLLLSFADNYHWYFVRYDEHILQSSWNTSEMGAVLRDFVAAGGDLGDVYHVAYPHWADTRNIAINAGDITWRNAVLDAEEIWSHVDDPDPKLYLLYPADERARQILNAAYPEGGSWRYDSAREGKDFIVFEAPRRPKGSK